MKIILNCWQLLALVLLVGCDSSSPEVHYTGISHESAAHLLTSTKDDRVVAETISRVKTDRRQGFDWLEFWTELHLSDTFKSYSPENKESTVSLFSLSCQSEVRDQQVLTVVDYPEFYRKIVGQGSPCSATLSLEVYLEILKRIASLSFDGPAENNLASLLVETLQARYESVGVDVEVRRALGEYTEQQWFQLMVVLINNKSHDHVVSMLKIHEMTFGTTQMLESILIPVAEDHAFFVQFLKKLGLKRVLNLFNGIPPQSKVLNNLSHDRWLELTENIMTEFLNHSFQGRSSAVQASEALGTFRMMLMFLTRFETNLPNILILNWSQEILNKMTDFMGADRGRTKVLAEANLDEYIIWLRLNLGQQIPSSDFVTIFSQHNSGSEVKELLRQLLRVFATSNFSDKRNAVKAYCHKLESLGIPNREIPFEQINTASFSISGCVQVADPQVESTIVFPGSEVSISPFSALLTRGVSVDFTNGGPVQLMVDATSEILHSDLAIEPPHSLDHGLVIPLALGVKLVRDTSLVDKGIYYIPFHYIYRQATDGRPADKKPQQGTVGGSIFFPKEYASAGQHLSLGGPGQSAVPRRLGGNGDVSEFSWLNFEHRLVDSGSSEQELARTLIRPSIQILSHLLEHAQTDENGSIKIYLQTNLWVRTLPAEQSQKIKSFCQNELEQPIATCLISISQQAAMQMHQQLQVALTEKEASHILPQISAEIFRLDPGQIGPVNVDGSVGEQGFVGYQDGDLL